MIMNRPSTLPTTAPMIVSGGTGRCEELCSDIPPDTDQEDDVGVGAVVRLSVIAVNVGDAVMEVDVDDVAVEW